MSRICEVTGKKSMPGNHVSHAKNKTKRRFLPNLHVKRFWIESKKKWIRLKVSSAGLRTIDKLGVEVALMRISNKKNIKNKMR